MLITYLFIKNGGDYDGGNFKMSFQVANVYNPNCKDNIVVFNLFSEVNTCDTKLFNMVVLYVL